MSSLRAVVETLTPDGDYFSIEAPEAWAQGRTLYGGMTAALAHEAVKRALGDLGPLRSSQFTFIGPASGKLRFNVALQRRGRSSAIVSVDCFNEEGLAARAMYVFGAPRESKVAHNYLTMPEVAPPEACGAFRKEGADTRRGFWDNFETRLASGGRFLEVTAPRPEFAVWTRFRDVGGADPTTALLAIADCLPPGAIVHFPQFGPLSTMTWTVDVTHVPSNFDGWFLLSASSEHTADGYSMQSMNMWSQAGEPIVVGRQAIAIFV
jgi:acyl-CoA thioesterase